MKKIFLSLLLVTVSSVVFAGSYDFECTAYHLDKKSSEIYKLTMSRDGATLDRFSEEVTITDPNINLFDGQQIYENKTKSITVKATVKKKATIVSLAGTLGPRDHIVDMNSVLIEVEGTEKGKKIKETYIGSCEERTITTCGGPCN